MDDTGNIKFSQHTEIMEDVLPGIQESALDQPPAPTAIMQSIGITTPQSCSTSTNEIDSQPSNITTSRFSKSASPHYPSNNTAKQLSDSITPHFSHVSPPRSPPPASSSLQSHATNSTLQSEKLATTQVADMTLHGSKTSPEATTQGFGTSILTQSNPVKSEKTGKTIAQRSELFVSQNEANASPSATSVKRPKSEPEDENMPFKTSIRRKKARGNPDLVLPYDDSVEMKDSGFAVDQPCFAKAEQLIAIIGEIVTNELEALAAEGYTEAELGIREKKLLKAMSPAQRGVPSWYTGIIGDTGCGKSSLINSLLNEQNATAEGDSGNVGTFVVTEFAMEDPSSHNRFRCLVWYYTNCEIDRLVKDHFAAVYVWETMKEKDKADLDTDEDEKYKNDCKMGAEFFETLLCSVDSTLRLQSTDDVKKYIKNANSATDKTRMDALTAAIQAYLMSLDRVGNTTTLYANDKADITAKTSNFAGRKNNDTQPSPWPLVQKITAFRPDPRILSGGMVLADLPGLSDTNSGRANAAKHYSKNCRTLVIAHDILRILTHPNVAKQIQNAWRAGRIEEIVIVATKTDSIKHGECRATSKADQEMFKKLTKQAEDWKDEAADLAADAKAALDEDEDLETYKALKKEADAKKQDAVEAKQALHEFNITIRNTDIDNQLQKLVQTLTGSATPIDVPVFCVSNALYQVHRKGYERSSPPDLSVAATQIPALRDHLFTKPAKMKLNKLVKVCKVFLPAALTGFELHCSKSRLEIKNDILPMVEKPYEEFRSAKNQTRREMKKIFDNHMSMVLTSNEADWQKQAAGHVAFWGKQPWMRFIKFCKLDGVWKVKKDEGLVDLDWNQCIADILSDGLVVGFSAIRKDFVSIRDEFEAKLMHLIVNLRERFEDEPALGGMDLGAFFNALAQRKESITDKIHDIFIELEEQVTAIRYRTLIPDNDDSYIFSNMQTFYKACLELSSKGSHTARKSLLKQKLTGRDNIFTQTIAMASVAFGDAAQAWSENAQTLLAEEFEGIKQDFEARFDNEEVEDESKKAGRKRLLAKVREAQAVLGMELMPVLAECEGFD